MHPSQNQTSLPLPPIVASLAVLLLLVPRVAAQAEPEQLVGRTVDATAVLADATYLQKTDRRTYLTMFGLRPTIVLLGSQQVWRKSKVKEYVATLRRLDKRAAQWRRRGIDVVLFLSHATIPGPAGRDAVDLKLGEKAKLRNLIHAEYDWRAGHPDHKRPIAKDMMLGFNSDTLRFRWLWISELGKIAAAGEDVSSKDLAQRVASTELAVAARSAKTKAAYDDLIHWRLGEASARLARAEVEAKAKEDTDTLNLVAGLGAMLERAESHYRTVIADPHKARGYLPEYADALTQIASVMYQGKSRGAAILAEIDQLRTTDEFAKAAADRARFLKVMQVHADNERRSTEAYEKAMRGRTGYEERLHYEMMIKHQSATLEQFAAYLESERASAYRKVVAIEYLELKEELDHGRSLVGGH